MPIMSTHYKIVKSIDKKKKIYLYEKRSEADVSSISKIASNQCCFKSKENVASAKAAIGGSKLSCIDVSLSLPYQGEKRSKTIN